MKKFSHLFIVVVAALFLVPVLANAESLVGTKYTTDLGRDVKVSLNGAQKSTWTVQFEAQVRDENGELVNGGEWFEGFCVELGQNAKIGGVSNVELVAPSLVNGGLHAAWIMENRDLYKPINTAWSQYEIAGLQLAIWEVTHDYSAALDYSLTAGTFKVVTAKTQARELANFYLSNLATMFSPDGLDSKYKIAKAAGFQDFIVNVPTNNPVPEPATMLLLGLGILGLAGVKRNVKK